jgi:hypothetical protein
MLVLFAIAAMGAALAGMGQVWHTTVQREKEAELLAIGGQFRNAIGSYYRSTPGSDKRWPQSIQDLLADRRSGKLVRHLRTLYYDPMTGARDWELVAGPKGIVGVRSRSDRAALKTQFSGSDSAFNGTTRYSQWVFGEAGSALAAPAAGAVPTPGDAPTPSPRSGLEPEPKPYRFPKAFPNENPDWKP